MEFHVRLGKGELTMHFRRDDGKRKIECGVAYGCITSVIEDVTCEMCIEVNTLATTLSTLCGCRRPWLHRPVAVAIIEMRSEHERS